MKPTDFTFNQSLHPPTQTEHLSKILEHARAASRQLGSRSTTQVKPSWQSAERIRLTTEPLGGYDNTLFDRMRHNRFEIFPDGTAVDYDHLPEGVKPPSTPSNTHSRTPGFKSKYGWMDNNIPLYPDNPTEGLIKQPNNMTIQGHLNAIESHAQSALDLNKNLRRHSSPLGGIEFPLTEEKLVTPDPTRRDFPWGTTIAWIVGILLLIGMCSSLNDNQQESPQEQGNIKPLVTQVA
jgi:hypothetical protein